MPNKHLTYFRVKNFKRFTDFELTDIGQFNLIVGDNNVGKTTILESLVVDEDNYQLTITRLIDTLGRRNMNFNVYTIHNYGNFNFLTFFINNKNNKNQIEYQFKYDNEPNSSLTLGSLNVGELSEIEKNILNTKFFSDDRNKGLAIVFKKNKELIVDYLYSFSQSPINKYNPFVPFHLGYADDLVEFYSSNIQVNNRVREFLYNSLRTAFIKNLDRVEPTVSSSKRSDLLVFFRDQGNSLPLFTQGEGAIKLFRIIAEIVICKGKRLMVDEIDSGIHFSRFKEYWKVILQACRENDTQLFATTHSIECLKYFKEALEESDMEEYRSKSRIFSCVETPEKEVKAITSTFDQFEYAINNNLELRGGK